MVLCYLVVLCSNSKPVRRIRLIGRPQPLSALLYPDAQKVLGLHDPLLLDTDFLSLNVR